MMGKRRDKDGFLIQRVPVPVLADLPRLVLLERATLSQPVAADRQLRVLCLVASGLPGAVRRRDAVELLDRPQGWRRRGEDQTGPTLAIARRGGGPVHPGLLQVRQFRRGDRKS